jgi:hypothetical protein
VVRAIVQKFGWGVVENPSFHAALCHGHLDVVQYMLSPQNTERHTLWLDETVVTDICSNGHAALMRTLPDTTPIPQQCLRLSHFSGSIAMVHEVRRRVGQGYQPTRLDIHELLRAPVPDHAVIHAFYDSTLESTDLVAAKLAVQHGRYEVVRFWLTVESLVHIHEVFLYACARGEHTIMELLVGRVTLHAVLQEGLARVRVSHGTTLKERLGMRCMITRHLGHQ